MITTELLSLLEIIRSLVNRKAELDKTYFDQFIEPAWNLFGKIQEDYKSSFQNYLEFVESDKYDPAVLVEKLRHDSLQSQDFRTELVEIVRNLPTAKFKVKEIYLLNFSKSIANYFSASNGLKFYSPNVAGFNCDDVEFFEIQETNRHDSPIIGDGEVIFGNGNVIRSFTMAQLFGADNADKGQSKLILWQAIQEFQSRHAEVASAFYKLRKELLS